MYSILSIISFLCGDVSKLPPDVLRKFQQQQQQSVPQSVPLNESQSKKKKHKKHKKKKEKQHDQEKENSKIYLLLPFFRLNSVPYMVKKLWKVI